MPSSVELAGIKFSKNLKFWIKKIYNFEELLGITFDCKLKFNNYTEDICKKAIQKLDALSIKGL